MLGINPDLKICIGSYSFALARKFGMGVQRIIESREYQRIFPATKLKGMGEKTNSTRTSEEFEIVGREGGVKLVGREGSLTGNRVDVMILDDIYKDAMEANSPIIRENAWEWYCSVVRTRMHNKSQEIIVFTRWHTDDLIGRLLKTEARKWSVINFEAIKTGTPTEIDPRQRGEALWSERHSLELLLERKELDPEIFEALYQGNPTSSKGLLYGEFDTYASIDEPVSHRSAYVDSADTGSDYLCAICYSVGAVSQRIYVTDVLYSNQAMEVTEKLTADMLKRTESQTAHVESNNGGRGFARSVASMVRCNIKTFHQSQNKEARIVSNVSQVMRTVIMPEGWKEKFPDFAQAIIGCKRNIKANAHDDAADALTGVVEKEYDQRSKKITAIRFN